MGKGKEKSDKEVLRETESLRQQVAEFGIMKRQYEWTEKRLQEEKKRAQNYLDIAGVMMMVIDKNGKVALINKKGSEILGYSQKEIIGKDWFSNFIPKGIRSETKEVFSKIINGAEKSVEYHENPILTKKGEERLISWNNAILKDDNGAVFATLSSGSDITKHKKAEEALEESEKKYRNLIEITETGFLILDCQGRVIDANKEYVRLTGYKKLDEIKGRKVTEWTAKYDLERNAEEVKKCAKKRYVRNLQIDYVSKKGEITSVEINANVIKLGEKPVIISLCRDVSERKKAEEELLVTKFVFDNMADAAFWIASDGQISYINNAACNLLKYSYEEVSSMKIFDIDVNFTPETWPRRWDEMKKDKIGKTETRFVDKEGKQFPVEIHGKYIKCDGQEYLCAIARDITERWRIEGALRRAEEEKAGILDSLSEMVVYFGKDMRILWANKAAGASSGLSPVELLGSRCYDVWHNREVPCEECPVVKVFNTGDYQEAEIALPDGRVWFARAHPVRDSEGDVSGVVEVISDITVKKRVEQERRQSLNKSRRILEETVIALAATAERRDPYTAGHQRRVAYLACAIAKEMNLDEDKIEGVRMASIIHDVGKVYVPAEMLSKPSELSDLEFSIIKTHSQIGYDILKPVEFPWPIAMIVLQHHEKMDGSGYPKGISGKDILIETRILTVADVVEAMASYRPYRAALGMEKALAEIQKNRGILYDKQAVDSCIKIFKKKQFKLE